MPEILLPRSSDAWVCTYITYERMDANDDDDGGDYIVIIVMMMMMTTVSPLSSLGLGWV